MPISLTVPLTIEHSEQKFKLLYIQFGSDSSVYIFLPRKKGYKISKDNHIASLRSGENTIKLDKSQHAQMSDTPYISFHPGKNISHLNLQRNGPYLNDAPIVELSAEPGASIFPLCNITFSDSQFLDPYKKRPDHEHELTVRENNAEKHLNIEFWVHSSDRHPKLEDLPFYEERIRADNIINFVTLSDERLGDYTVSLLVTEMERTPVAPGEEPLSGIIVTSWRKGQPSFSLLEPA